MIRDLWIDDDGVNIEWDDGQRCFWPHRYLRGHCCCAGCVEEMTGRRRISEDDVREDVFAVEWMPIGRYAVQFLWSDAHDSGIYPFELLKRLCHCTECAGEG